MQREHELYTELSWPEGHSLPQDQCVNWEELAKKQCSLPGARLGGEQLCRASLPSLGFDSSLLFITMIVNFTFLDFFYSPALRDSDRGLSQQLRGWTTTLLEQVSEWSPEDQLLGQTGELSSWARPQSRLCVLVVTQVSARARSRLQGWRTSTQTLAPTEGWATCHLVDVWMFGVCQVKSKFLIKK